LELPVTITNVPPVPSSASNRPEPSLVLATVRLMFAVFHTYLLRTFARKERSEFVKRFQSFLRRSKTPNVRIQVGMFAVRCGKKNFSEAVPKHDLYLRALDHHPSTDLM
jgi:hypothetical protein